MKKVLPFLLLTALLTTGCGISGNDNSYALENEVPANTSEDTTQPTYDFEIPKSARATLKTNHGEIVINFFPQDAPITVNNFIVLAQSDFYDGVKFHRVIPNFMIQTGDPNSKDDNWLDDGTGGSGKTFKDEINGKKHVRGIVSMANRGANTNDSQFFIMTGESAPHLDSRHTIFGEVVEGMDVVDTIEALPVNPYDHPTQDAIIEDIVLEIMY